MRRIFETSLLIGTCACQTNMMAGRSTDYGCSVFFTPATPTELQSIQSLIEASEGEWVVQWDDVAPSSFQLSLDMGYAVDAVRIEGDDCGGLENGFSVEAQWVTLDADWIESTGSGPRLFLQEGASSEPSLLGTLEASSLDASMFPLPYTPETIRWDFGPETLLEATFAEGDGPHRYEAIARCDAPCVHRVD